MTHSCLPGDDILGFPTAGKGAPPRFSPPPLWDSKPSLYCDLFCHKISLKGLCGFCYLMVIELQGKQTAPSAFSRRPRGEEKQKCCKYVVEVFEHSSGTEASVTITLVLHQHQPEVQPTSFCSQTPLTAQVRCTLCYRDLG